MLFRNFFFYEHSLFFFALLVCWSGKILSENRLAIASISMSSIPQPHGFRYEIRVYSWNRTTELRNESRVITYLTSLFQTYLFFIFLIFHSSTVKKSKIHVVVGNPSAFSMVKTFNHFISSKKRIRKSLKNYR